MKRRLIYSILYISNTQRDGNLFENLNNNGFDIIDVQDIEKIGESIQKRMPQIVVIETNSKEYAIDALNILRNVKETVFIPKIVLSTISDVKTKIEIFENGSNDYIIKPYDFNELVVRLNCFLINGLYIDKITNENSRLKSVSIIDDITGLYNKKYLQTRLVEEISRASRMGECISFGIIECANYDEIMNAYGESALNYVLKEICEIIKQLARLSDVILRYDAHQLAVLSPITNRAGLDTFMDRILHKINDSVFEYSGQIIKFTINIGAYTLESSDFNTFESKITNITKFAEEALERAKNSEQNRVEFYE